MALDVFDKLMGLFRDRGTPEAPLDPVAQAIQQLRASSETLREEVSRALDRVSEQVGCCLEHEFLRSEWDRRVWEALAVDPADQSGLALQALERARLHAHRVDEYRADASREEGIVQALEQRLGELDTQLSRLVRELDVLRTATDLKECRRRVTAVLDNLLAATGLEFLTALGDLRGRADQELAAAETRESAGEPSASSGQPSTAAELDLIRSQLGTRPKR